MVCRESAPGAQEPSLRHYVRAKELKAAGMDWTEVLAAEEENRTRLVTEILASPAYDSTAAHIAAYCQQGGGCRATFFNYRRSAGGRPRKALAPQLTTASYESTVGGYWIANTVP